MGMLFLTASLILNQSTWFGTLRREMTAPFRVPDSLND